MVSSRADSSIPPGSDNDVVKKRALLVVWEGVRLIRASNFSFFALHRQRGIAFPCTCHHIKDEEFQQRTQGERHCVALQTPRQTTWAVLSWATRVRVVSDCTSAIHSAKRCTFTNVSCEWVFCVHAPSVVGKFLCRPTETGLKIENFSRMVRPWRMPGIPTSRRPIVAFPICGRGRWRRRRQVSLRWFIEPPACSRIDRTVVFFNSFERLFFSLSYLLASRNGSTFLLGPCHIFVV